MTSDTVTAEPFLSGLFFGECPRWHDGRLWYSDFFDHAVFSASPDGERRVEVPFDGEPAGLGGCPTADSSSTPASTAPSCAASPTAHCPPRRSHARGPRGTPTTWWWPPTARPTRATSGSTSTASTTGGSTPATSPPRRSSGSTPTARATRPPTDIDFPNGTVITDDGATLIIAESLGGRLTAFDRDAGRHPDQPARVGRAARASRPTASACAPTARSGSPTRWRPSASASPKAARSSNAWSTSMNCFACMLGDDDRRTLYLVTAPDEPRRQGKSGAQRRHREGADDGAGGRPALTARGPPLSRAWSSALRRLRTAWPMRCSFSMRAKRTCPSPPGPNPTPGEVATSASLTRYLENSSEPISR